MTPFRFCGYADSSSEPNVVVDGSPNESTVLTLTHWPGYLQPPGFHLDLSAEMAFHYVDHGFDHPHAEVVTNNHYDQDGLVSAHALIEPELATQHRRLLIDVAAAGDFGTYRDRRAARASMTIAAYADSDRSPLANRLAGSYDQQCVVLYEETIPLLVPMVVDNESFRDLWSEEDDELAASEKAIASGVVTIDEVPEVDLAVVTIPIGEQSRGGHRFASEYFDAVHPMALHNATGCFRLLVLHGRRYQFVDRYETWVQYRSKRPLPRVDMRPLAERLSRDERRSASWTASAPGSLTPTMRVVGESSLDQAVVRQLVIDHLGHAPPAWDPYRANT
ncbi:MAG: DUF6687 family protein [Ilumatobacteraceae bacterium]